MRRGSLAIRGWRPDQKLRPERHAGSELFHPERTCKLSAKRHARRGDNVRRAISSGAEIDTTSAHMRQGVVFTSNPSLLGLPMPEHHSSTLSPDEGKMSNAADDHASAAPGRDDDQAPETAVVNKVGSFRHGLYTADQLDGVDPWR